MSGRTSSITKTTPPPNDRRFHFIWDLRGSDWLYEAHL